MLFPFSIYLMRSVEVGRIDLSLVESAGLDAPMLEDLHVRAVIHQLLHGLLHGLVELLVALLDGDALLGHAFNVAERLKPSVWEIA